MMLRKEFLQAKGMIQSFYATARLIGDERMIEFYGEVLEMCEKEGP